MGQVIRAGFRHSQDNYLSENYIACLDLNFGWRPADVSRVREAWKAGVPIDEIARMVRRDCDEVAVLCIDLARKGEIEKRPMGVYGGRKGR